MYSSEVTRSLRLSDVKETHSAMKRFTAWSRVLEKLIVAQLSEDFLSILFNTMFHHKVHNSPVLVPYPALAETTPHPSILFLKDPF
jgi:hypothetical protein